MRGRVLVATAVGVAGLLLGFSAAPALAQPTTPVPTPGDPGSPGMSSPVGAVPPGRAVGDAGTGLGILRILPNSSPTRAILPGAEDKLPKQAAAELGFGLASAQVNSEAYLTFERSVAQAAPGALAIQGATPQAPGSLSQTASPDNAEPVHGGLTLPSTPLDTLIRAGALQGQVHARWSDTAGPCVGTISDATTEVASLSLLNAIPTLPSTPDLTGVFDSPADANADQAIIDGLKKLAGPLSTLGGVLAGGSAPAADGAGSLISLPNTLSARSVVRLVDIPGSANKAVESTSTMQVANVTLLAGTPFEIQIRVVSQPTLQVTSTGDEKTSTVRYTAPVLAVEQGGKTLGQLDAANPRLDIPVGIPLAAGAPNLPIIGDLLADGQRATAALNRLDLGVIRLGVAQLDQRGVAMTSPFAGYQLGATARMLDLQVLPTQALGLPNLPSALAQVSLGEQVARAYAPSGGAVCPSEQPTPPPTPAPQGRGPMPLAYTTMAYKTIPLFWTGTAMLLVGVVLVAALPRLRTAGGPDVLDADTDPADDAPDADAAEGAPGTEADTAEAASNSEAEVTEAAAPDAEAGTSQTETPDAEPQAPTAETETPEAEADTGTDAKDTGTGAEAPGTGADTAAPEQEGTPDGEDGTEPERDERA